MIVTPKTAIPGQNQQSIKFEELPEVERHRIIIVRDMFVNVLGENKTKVYLQYFVENDRPVRTILLIKGDSAEVVTHSENVLDAQLGKMNAALLRQGIELVCVDDQLDPGYKESDKNKSPTEEDGVKAIIYLQRMMGITETEVSARAGWLLMSPDQQQETMNVYKGMVMLEPQPGTD